MSLRRAPYALVLESEAEREAQVNRAEGMKQKVILEATAEAESIKARGDEATDVWGLGSRAPGLGFRV